MEEKKVKPEQKKSEKKKQQAKKDTQSFKNKYFEFYDDVKISDRQDW